MRSKRIKMTLLAASLLICLTQPVGAKIVFLNDSIVVEPGRIVYYSFQAAKSEGVRVMGGFRARGGNRNDIEVFILDDIGFENFMNGHSTPTYYNSGRVTIAKINVFLPAQKYFLVFNNRFSAYSNKAVRAFIELD